MYPEGLFKEAEDITSILLEKLPKHVEGKDAILELKKANYQWRQMEWIGWYYEFKIFTILSETIGGAPGPSYGNTTFDYKRNLVWDLKAHPKHTNKGTPNEPMILNDQEAVEACVAENAGVGFIVVKGEAKFDNSGEFKIWHDALKGGTSAYEHERIRRGATSRTRKVAFDIESIDAYFIEDQSVLDTGIQEGWLKFFQKDMRNADGSPRRAKYALRTDRVPPSLKITSVGY